MNGKKLIMVGVVVVLAVAGGFALGGFGGGLTGKVIGIWHYQLTPFRSRTNIARDCFLEISETAVLDDGLRGQKKQDVVLEEKDGKVLVLMPDRIEDTRLLTELGLSAEDILKERTIYVITPVDHDTITIDDNRTLTRSTAEARAAGLEKNKKTAEADEAAEKAYGEEYRKKLSGDYEMEVADDPEAEKRRKASGYRGPER